MTDHYRTDKWILNMFEGWFDPCPFDNNWVDDGLLAAWPSKTFVNPPYSNPRPWVENAIGRVEAHGGIVVMLLKHDSSTEWYRLLHEAGARFMLVNGRLKHQTGERCPFPSMLAIIGGDDFE